MNKITALVLSLAYATLAIAASDLENKALQGDYQAQRNLAFGYATGSSGQKKDTELACSWYLLVMRSDSDRLGIGDVGNIVTYCDKLDFDKRLSAEKKANLLYKKIYQK